MIHYAIGNIGHLFVITSFVSALISAFAFFKARNAAIDVQASWLQNGRWAFGVHAFSVVGIVVSLFGIIYNHYFEYHYAFSHSSLHLPKQYMISCFWEGQEGAFLLWMFWHALLGMIVIFTKQKSEASVMVIVTLVQVFLASMILGIVLPWIDIKLGSSPFILLRDAIKDPVFLTNPDFIPSDGNGLNPLLQNYWMVIHPPTLFLGMALTLFPFAFCVASLWDGKYTEWVKPALPWTVLGAAILGLGILMGGYWAYETLNFGGYWNWDPVENAVYVPWLIMIAAMHTMITYRNSNTALKASAILVITVFVLILYSTFLARSGILGDASVHSFTDLGLSGQLLIYMLFFTVIAYSLLVARWKKMPSSEKDTITYSREFWIFLGVTVLCLMGFQVLVPTSYPVINKIASWFGIDSRLAVSGDQVVFYSTFQLWFAVLVCLISATGQFFWWRKMEIKTWRKEVMPVILASLVVFAITIALARVSDPAFMVLTLAGIYLIISNVRVLYSVAKVNPRLSGGAVAHIGVGLMLIGIMFSAGYSKIVSLNNNGMLINRELGAEFNRDNLFLFVNEPKTMAEYDIEYRGERYELRDKNGYVNKTDVQITRDQYKVIAKKDIFFKDKQLYAALDTIAINPENTYYEIQMRSNNKVAATLYPRIQENDKMEGFIASPDIKHDIGVDIYAHVSAYPNYAEIPPEWKVENDERVHIGETFFVNDYVATLKDVTRVEKIAGLHMEADDIAVKATIEVQGENEIYTVEPVFLIREKSQVGLVPEEIVDLGARFTLNNIHPDTQEFTIGISSRQKDWVIIKAKSFPMINILWLGTGVLMVGFGMSLVRRFQDYRKAR
jgi:cytochrome c-type biogenesis protein CcmF